MEAATSDSGRRIISTVMEYSDGQMAVFIKENGN
jgi:hypothetical protein